MAIMECQEPSEFMYLFLFGNSTIHQYFLLTKGWPTLSKLIYQNDLLINCGLFPFVVGESLASVLLGRRVPRSGIGINIFLSSIHHFLTNDPFLCVFYKTLFLFLCRGNRWVLRSWNYSEDLKDRKVIGGWWGCEDGLEIAVGRITPRLVPHLMFSSQCLVLQGYPSRGRREIEGRQVGRFFNLDQYSLTRCLKLRCIKFYKLQKVLRVMPLKSQWSLVLVYLQQNRTWYG